MVRQETGRRLRMRPSIRALWVGALSLSSRACCAGRRLMMRRSPSLSGPTRQSESSGHAPSGTMAAFDAWLEVRGHGAGALFSRAVRGGRVGERQLTDAGVAGIRAIGQRRLAWPLSHHATCGAPLSLSCSTPAPTWRVSKRRLAMRARRRWPATLGAEMQPSAKPPISCTCRFSSGRPE
jgi:hypothetical protein